MDAVEDVNSYYIGNLKANSSRYPKFNLFEKMSKWPSSSYLKLKITLNKKRTVYALGCK